METLAGWVRTRMSWKMFSQRISLVVSGYLWSLMLLVFAYPAKAPLLFREHPLRVLVFLDTECPICQKTTRRVQQMADEYKGQVQFEAVYPTKTVTLTEVAAFEREYGLTLPHRLDSKHRLVKQYDATTTPEVLLLSQQGKILYRGSVDNQFYRLGRFRPAPSEFYLKNAIDATLAGQPIRTKQTTPTGCLINR